MVRRRVSSTAQPWWIRIPLRVYEFSASLELAVLTIFFLAGVLAYATFVESAYGTPAVQFGLYQTWWFNVLNAVLAVNIFCAASIRYPWKRHQTGFVVTHIGLLILLFGCLVSRQKAIDAQMPIVEGRQESKAFEGKRHLDLGVQLQGESRPRALTILPFETGPFDWRQYSNALFLNSPSLARSTDGKLPFLPWGLAARHHPGDVLYQQDGIKLEVLDFIADAEQADVPEVVLELLPPRRSPQEAVRDTDWMPLSLRISSQTAAGDALYPYGLGDMQNAGGGAFAFWTVGKPIESQAFLQCTPENEVQGKGQVVLLVQGAKHVISVDERLGKGKFALSPDWEAEVVQWYASPSPPIGAAALARDVNSLELREQSGAVDAEKPAELACADVRLYRQGASAGRLILFARYPFLNLSSTGDAAAGAYWYRHLQDVSSSRCDIVQTAEGKLLYRSWSHRRGAVVASGELPADHSPVSAFKMQESDMQMRLKQFTPSMKPSTEVRPLPFDRDKDFWRKQAAAKFRLSVDGESQEFWLFGMGIEETPRGLQQQTVQGKNRSVTMVMKPDFVDIGFNVRLDKFVRKLDPGTSQPSHYWSDVAFIDKSSGKPLRENVRINMNAPQEFVSPETRECYRLFQESFSGPFRPGDPTYASLTADLPFAVRRKYAEEIYSSTLTVNVDPGRGLKYLGSAFVVLGIATMFYMKAYFFNSKADPQAILQASKTKLSGQGGGSSKLKPAKK